MVIHRFQGVIFARLYPFGGLKLTEGLAKRSVANGFHAGIQSSNMIKNLFAAMTLGSSSPA
jgi:hypothetical protein